MSYLLSQAMAGFGALAQRPAPDSVPSGYLYVATDNGIVYQSQSAAWVSVIVSAALGAWTAPSSFGANFASNGAPNDPITAALEPIGFVSIRGVGLAGGVVAGGAPLFTLPVGLRPGNTKVYPAFLSTGMATFISIAATGVVSSSAALANGNTIPFDGLRFERVN